MNNTEKLFTTIAEVFNESSDDINLETTQDDLENWDSLGTINLIIALEQLFKVNIDIIEIAEMDQVVLIKNFLSSKGVRFE